MTTETYPAPEAPTTTTLSCVTPDGWRYDYHGADQPCGQGGLIPPATLVAVVTPTAPTHQLPVTGGDVAGLLVLGAVSFAAGVALLRGGRARPSR